MKLKDNGNSLPLSLDLGNGAPSEFRTTQDDSAPAKIVTIIFDGGAINNGSVEARVYGSFLICGLTPEPVLIRKTYQEYHTCNEAEMNTALCALRHLREMAGDETLTMSVYLTGDSQLAINCLSGKWRIRQENLKPFRLEMDRLRPLFRSIGFKWHPRRISVVALGH